jgi:hypothetical protein
MTNPKKKKSLKQKSNRQIFLEMQKLMIKTIERMINKKLENFRPLASPQTQCMSQSQKPSHEKCTNC